jgi:SAM-dependent methyltransferase
MRKRRNSGMLPSMKFLQKKFARQASRRRFAEEYERFVDAAKAASSRFEMTWDDRHPCLDDRTTTTTFDRHYVFHTAWAARVLAQSRPRKHVDIGSSLYFAGIVSAFVPTEFYDLRPAALNLSNLQSRHADLMRLPFGDGEVESLSCMHVVEHVGLGRYGDPIDPDGDLKAMRELQRVVAPAGSLLFVVPVGRPRVQFNAHRIYSYQQVQEAFSELEICQFSLIPDLESDGGLLQDASPDLVPHQRYACGCFWLRRPASRAAGSAGLFPEARRAAPTRSG